MRDWKHPDPHFSVQLQRYCGKRRRTMLQCMWGTCKIDTIGYVIDLSLFNRNLYNDNKVNIMVRRSRQSGVAIYTLGVLELVGSPAV